MTLPRQPTTLMASSSSARGRPQDSLLERILKLTVRPNLCLIGFRRTCRILMSPQVSTVQTIHSNNTQLNLLMSLPRVLLARSSPLNSTAITTLHLRRKIHLTKATSCYYQKIMTQFTQVTHRDTFQRKETRMKLWQARTNFTWIRVKLKSLTASS